MPLTLNLCIVKLTILSCCCGRGCKVGLRWSACCPRRVRDVGQAGQQRRARAGAGAGGGLAHGLGLGARPRGGGLSLGPVVQS